MITMNDYLYTIIDNFKDAVLLLDKNASIIYANKICRQFFCNSQGNFIGKNIDNIFPEPGSKIIKKVINHIFLQEQLNTTHTEIIDADNRILELTFTRHKDNKNEFVILYMKELTKEAEYKRYVQFINKLFTLSNKKTIQLLLKTFVKEILKYTKCQAVAIRIIKEDLSIVNEYNSGFPDFLYQMKKPPDAEGYDCICVSVIRGDYDPANACFTKKGSFYLNEISNYFATISPDEGSKIRNAFNKYEFESFALIPIPYNNKNIGLVYLADSRRNMVTRELVQRLEYIANHLAETIERIIAREKLEQHKQILEMRVKERTAALVQKNKTVKNTNEKRKQLLKQLNMQRKYLINLAQSVPGVIFQFIINSDGHSYFPYINGNLIKELDLDTRNAALDAKQIFQYIPGEDIDIIQKTMSSQFKIGGAISIRFQFIKNPGQPPRWLRMNAILTFFTKKERQWTGVIIDVTEMFLQEKELHNRERRLRKAQELAHLGDWEYNVQTRQLIFSEQFFKIFSLLGQVPSLELLLTVIHPDDKEIINEAINNIRNKLKPLQLTFRIICPDKSVHWIFSQAEIIKDDFGQVLLFYGTVQDITESKQREDLLLDSEEKFRKLFMEMKFGCTLQELIFDENGTPVDYVTLDMNPASERMLGINKVGMLGKLVSHFLPHDEFIKWLEIFSHVALARESVNYEQFSPHNNKHFEGVAYSPKYGQFAVTFDDVTEKKRAEIKLQESEKQYREIYEKTPVMLQLNDKKGCLLSVSDQWLKVMGYKREEVLGRESVEFLNSESQNEAVNKYFPILIKKGFINNVPLRYMTKTKRALDLLFSAIVFYDNDNNMKNSLIVLIDVTEKMRAEKLLIESEQKFRNLAELSPMGIFILQKKKILYANKTCSTLLGLSLEDFIYKSIDVIEQIIYPGDIPNSKFLLKSPKSAFDIFLDKMEFKIKINNNECRWVKVYASAIPFNNKPAKMFCIVDTTEQKIAERQIENSRKELRELYNNLQNLLEEERKRISREIHDELGQSLTVLKIDLYWLNKRLPRNSDALRNKCNDMLQIVDKTIEIVRTISQTLRPGLLDNIGLVSAIEWQAKEYEKHTGLKFNIRLLNESVNIQSDKAIALFRIFQETVINIIRHANATKVEIQYFLANNKINLIVRDNGRGIKKEEIEDSHSLGILGIRERVLPFNGSVEIRGNEKYGTTISVSLPL